MNISTVFIGPRGSGKTSVARELARLEGIAFQDADDLFLLEYGPISSFVDNYGWEKFRENEVKIIEELAGWARLQRVSLALGGGAVAHDQGEAYRQQNVGLVRNMGEVVYLLPSENLVESAKILSLRIEMDKRSKGNRPSLTGRSSSDKMLQVLEKRHPLYFEAAHSVIYTGDRTPLQIVQQIQRAYSK